MDYKETLVFIGRALTMSQDQAAFDDVSKLIRSREVNWEMVVEISTSHYVLPALFCNLRRKKFLSELPLNLVVFMKHLTNVNRERNQQILKQVDEINHLLINHGIMPIYLKGVGNLLDGLYEDIAERMIGDIDFIVAPKDQERTFHLLVEHGYGRVSPRKPLPGKHYPRLANPHFVAAVEVHKHTVKEPFEKILDYQAVVDTSIEKSKFSILSHENQLCLSIIAKQINDNGQYFNTIHLRSAYDVWLLSQKVCPLTSIKRFKDIFHPLNNFLGLCNYVLSDKIIFDRNDVSSEYVSFFNQLSENKKLRIRHQIKWSRKLKINLRLMILKKALFLREYRVWVFRTITSKFWLSRRLGVIKTSFN